MDCVFVLAAVGACATLPLGCTRPTREQNMRRLREAGESLDSNTLREAVAADIPALAELHVTTWNATYRTSRGPSIATREAQWRQELIRDFR
jgi:hypothetical protein